ncbi:hypothetical protein D7V64_10525 [Acinetobacter cumulans]|uniref:Uncharacterized protein n=1 Tax=Acinetobacter cumulans TaxID=2136182 RepID=A0A3A8G0Z2_9GAMM|nr:hypothetical protein D7V51_12830 [Acinetobacter cumulans]RKG47689.1 hypothetical protein D7V68_10610 [Acinetobacter cumulans]RKG52119.1 hypothetical protein D7V64_10525 [Acinetobacter cumulans]
MPMTLINNEIAQFSSLHLWLKAELKIILCNEMSLNDCIKMQSHIKITRLKKVHFLECAHK